MTFFGRHHEDPATLGLHWDPPAVSENLIGFRG